MISAESCACVVLAGGLGTRLRSVVSDRPKCLAPVGGRTFLDVQIETLLRNGVDHFVLALGYMADAVVSSVQTWKGRVPIHFVVEERPLGTGGAVAHALDFYGLDEALVVNGDTYLGGKIGPMRVPLRRSAGELLRMAVVTVPDRSRFGGVQIGPAGRVAGFVDKGAMGPGAVNAGLYRLCRDALPAPGDQAYSLEADVLPRLVRQNAVSAAPIHGEFVDIGVPEDYQRFVTAILASPGSADTQ